MSRWARPNKSGIGCFICGMLWCLRKNTNFNNAKNIASWARNGQFSMVSSVLTTFSKLEHVQTNKL